MPNPGRKQDRVLFPLEVEEGRPGVDQSETNPLSRAARAILAEGKAQQALHVCLYSPTGRRDQALPQWIGAFVHSAGGRILFFQGPHGPGRLVLERDGTLDRDARLEVDHFTLSSTRRTWHVTTSNGSHQRGGDTLPMSNGLVRWLILDVKEQALPPVKRRTHAAARISKEARESDLERREKLYGQVLDHGDHPIVTLEQTQDQRQQPGFIRLFLTVGPSGAPAPTVQGVRWYRMALDQEDILLGAEWEAGRLPTHLRIRS